MEVPLWDSQVTRKKLIENISLLRTLNELPETPHDNSLEAPSNQIHHLALDRESEIACNLAFLSATTDDSKNVMAVCVQEDENGRGITIRVASNSGELTNIVQGLETLGRVLETAAQRGNLKAKDKRSLLREIVKFDVSRILSRLRSAHAGYSFRRRGKPALIAQLNEALKHVKTKRGVSLAILQDLRRRAIQLASLSSRLEDLPDLDIECDIVQDILMEIVTQSHMLRLTSKLGPALSTSTVLDPSLIAFLPEAFGKLGRYYAAASELVCAARDKACPVFLNVRVEPCEFLVPQDHFMTDTATSIRTVADRISQSSRMPSRSRRVKILLEDLEIQSQFQARVSDIAPSGKVHAEIQLLFFYELHPDVFRPRVICSSKSACYLCNLFFQLHGQFHMPRTHGRLYHKWVLPDWLGGLTAEKRQRFGVIVTDLNKTVENRIREEFRMKSQNRNPPPNESCDILPAFWPSTSVLVEESSSSQSSTRTLRQAASIEEENDPISTRNRSIVVLDDIAEQAHEEDLQDNPRQANSTISSSSSSATTPTAEKKSTSRSGRDSSTHTTSPRSSHYSHQRQASPLPPRSSPHKRHHHQRLSLRKPYWHDLSTDNTPLLASTPSIYATVSSAMDAKDAKDEMENRWVELTWLHEEELQQTREEECKPDGKEVVIQLQDFEVGKEVFLRPPVGDLHLRYRGDVLLIRHSLSRPK